MKSDSKITMMINRIEKLERRLDRLERSLVALHEIRRTEKAEVKQLKKDSVTLYRQIARNLRSTTGISTSLISLIADIRALQEA